MKFPSSPDAATDSSLILFSQNQGWRNRDLSITPAQVSLFARWEGEDQYLKIRPTSQFIQQVAKEALDMDSDRLELLPQARTREPHIEAIGLMLLSELQQGHTANTLYIESLANVLAVHLIRQHTTDRA